LPEGFAICLCDGLVIVRKQNGRRISKPRGNLANVTKQREQIACGGVAQNIMRPTGKAKLPCHVPFISTYIWGDFTQAGIAGKIRAALTEAGQDGLTRSQLNDELGGRITQDEYMPELEKLIASGEVTETKKDGRGRTAKIYHLR